MTTNHLYLNNTSIVFIISQSLNLFKPLGLLNSIYRYLKRVTLLSLLYQLDYLG